MQSTDLEEHLAWIADQLVPVASQFAQVRGAGIQADIFCFLLGVGHGGPRFSPSIMGRLARLDLALGLDIYFAED